MQGVERGGKDSLSHVCRFCCFLKKLISKLVISCRCHKCMTPDTIDTMFVLRYSVGIGFGVHKFIFEMSPSHYFLRIYCLWIKPDLRGHHFL